MASARRAPRAPPHGRRPARCRDRRRRRRRRPDRPPSFRWERRAAKARVYRIGIAAALYFRHPSSLEHDTGGHPESPRRIAAIESALELEDWAGFERRDAPEVSAAALTAVHPESYVAGLREFCAAGGGQLDIDTVASRGSYAAALHAAGGACALVDALLAGEASTGFCGLRPPGHHAEPATAMGFCLFNNVAVAARHALATPGVERVLVLDWDVHHGNGTHDIFHASPSVLYASIHESPLYPGTGALDDAGSGEGEGYTLNLPVPPGSGHDRWLSLVEHVVVQVARQFAPQLILVSAGFDAHAADPLATCELSERSFAEMAAHMRLLGAELGSPVGCVLEGGYALDALSRSLVATLGALTSELRPTHVDAAAVSDSVREQVSRHWSL